MFSRSLHAFSRVNRKGFHTTNQRRRVPDDFDEALKSLNERINTLEYAVRIVGFIGILGYIKSSRP